MIVNAKNGICSWDIHRALGLTQKTAWFMLHRIRKAMSKGSFVKIGGPGSQVEADETFIGGKGAKHAPVGKEASYYFQWPTRKTASMGSIGTWRRSSLRSNPHYSQAQVSADCQKARRC
jgi:hypothetical protein